MWWFETGLTSIVFLCAILTIVGFFSAPMRQKKLVKIARSYLPVFLLVLVVRSFIFQPFKVVSGSLEPTVLVGDYLAVNQSAYGLRLPVIHKKIFNTGEPRLGEIALFYFPEDPSMVFVKRVIGVPGDHIVYQDKRLTINGKTMPQFDDGIGFDIEPSEPPRIMEQKIEDLGILKHSIFVSKMIQGNVIDVVVPKGMYFMMGDNRDDSDDSRRWGFVPEANLIGRAYRVLMSWDGEKMKPRFGRIGNQFKLS
jgi:signal peptidase I